MRPRASACTRSSAWAWQLAAPVPDSAASAIATESYASAAPAASCSGGGITNRSSYFVGDHAVGITRRIWCIISRGGPLKHFVISQWDHNEPRMSLSSAIVMWTMFVQLSLCTLFVTCLGHQGHARRSDIDARAVSTGEALLALKEAKTATSTYNIQMLQYRYAMSYIALYVE